MVYLTHTVPSSGRRWSLKIPPDGWHRRPVYREQSHLKPKIRNKSFAEPPTSPEALIYSSLSSVVETQTAQGGGLWDKAWTRSCRSWRSGCVRISATQSGLVPRYDLKRRGHTNPYCDSEKPWPGGNMCRKRHIRTESPGFEPGAVVTTVAPAPLRRCTMASPMLRVPPVTSARLPVNSVSEGSAHRCLSTNTPFSRLRRRSAAA
jgi:hypothetical protein